MEAKIIACILIGIFFGPVASLAITPIFCLLRIIFYVPFIRKSLREEAERKGHVVKASLKKNHDLVSQATMRKKGNIVIKLMVELIPIELFRQIDCLILLLSIT